MTDCPACGRRHPHPGVRWWCWLAANDRRYQRQWGLPETAPEVRPPVPDWVRRGGQGPAGGSVSPATPPPPRGLTFEELVRVRGLGDDVEAVAKVIGADRLAKLYESVTGKPCGCRERRDLLNKLPSVWGAVRALLSMDTPPPPGG
jgi:hypothetical protein